MEHHNQELYASFAKSEDSNRSVASCSQKSRSHSCQRSAKRSMKAAELSMKSDVMEGMSSIENASSISDVQKVFNNSYEEIKQLNDNINASNSTGEDSSVTSSLLGKRKWSFEISTEEKEQSSE